MPKKGYKQTPEHIEKTKKAMIGKRRRKSLSKEAIQRLREQNLGIRRAPLGIKYPDTGPNRRGALSVNIVNEIKHKSMEQS